MNVDKEEGHSTYGSTVSVQDVPSEKPEISSHIVAGGADCGRDIGTTYAVSPGGSALISERGSEMCATGLEVSDEFDGARMGMSRYSVTNGLTLDRIFVVVKGKNHKFGSGEYGERGSRVAKGLLSDGKLNVINPEGVRARICAPLKIISGI